MSLTGAGPRSVTLVLVDADGVSFGALPPFAVAVPWWPEVWDVVAGAREHFGLDVMVLRILATEPGRHSGGAVTYLAQVDDPGSAPVVRGSGLGGGRGGLGGGRGGLGGGRGGLGGGRGRDDHPLRAEYARPGGPERALRWAAEALERAGRGPVTSASQRKTWNLSAIWRLVTPAGPVWLKQVPPFLAHEATVLAWLASPDLTEHRANEHRANEHRANEHVVPLVAAEGGRMLLEHVAGEDLFDADVDIHLAVAADTHDIQAFAGTRIDALLAAGVPDSRAGRLSRIIGSVVAEHGGGDAGLTALVEGLDDRFAAVAACGVPDTLVHGDLHPGNVRGSVYGSVHGGVDGGASGGPSSGPSGGGGRRVLIDWADSCVAHPAFDLLRLADGLDHHDAARLVDAWAARWRRTVPGCEPRRALELLRPVAALRNAAVYAHFLANIEPAEHRYHRDDVPHWLHHASTHDASKTHEASKTHGTVRHG